MGAIGCTSIFANSRYWYLFIARVVGFRPTYKTHENLADIKFRLLHNPIKENDKGHLCRKIPGLQMHKILPPHLQNYNY